MGKPKADFDGKQAMAMLGQPPRESFMQVAALMQLVRPLKFDIVEFSQLPLYNQDDETNPPQRRRVQAADRPPT
jgi:hypothetical protein